MISRRRTAKWCISLQQAQVGAGAEARLMVIGGAEIYRLCLPQAVRIHLTLVHARITDGDTFFGAWRDPEWKEAGRERHEADEKNAYAYSFLTLDRARSARWPARCSKAVADACGSLAPPARNSPLRERPRRA